MAINQVIYGGKTLMDVTDSTVTEENLVEGAVAYNAAGERIVGGLAPVLYTPRELTETQKAQARENIGAASDWDVAIPDYWADAVAKAEEKITAFQNFGGSDSFTFGFITDTHTESGDSRSFGDIMERVMHDCNIPFMLHGGDFASGLGIKSKAELIAEIKHHDYLFRNVEDKMLTAVGNHDYIFGVDSNYDSCLTAGEEYNYIFRKNEGKNGLVYGETGTYFYKDIPTQKVRCIVLDSFNYEPVLDETQKIVSGDKLRVGKFGAVQLTWLAEVALDVPDGYSVVICSHNAPYRTSDLPEAWRTETTALLDCDVALGIVNAYRNKAAYSYSGIIGDGILRNFYAMDFDFSQRKGEVVCWVSGHTHMDRIFNLDGLMLIVTANCSSHIAVTDAPNKVSGTDTEYIMDFVCINKRAKVCNIVRLGAELETNASCSVTTYTNLSDPTSEDWIIGKRINSAGELVDDAGYGVSNYIPMFSGTVHCKGINLVANRLVIQLFRVDKTLLATRMLDVTHFVADYDHSVIFCNTKTEFALGSICYIRLSGQLTTTAEDVIITVDENIETTVRPGRGFNY